jgi:hypothetical protein
MEMSQETRKRQNDFLAARGGDVPPVGTELDPVPYVNYVMPPLDDDMFTGVEDFEDFEPPSEPEDADEDEGAHGEEDREGSPVLSEDFLALASSTLLSLFGISMPKGEKSVESLGITSHDTSLASFSLVLKWLVSFCAFICRFYLSNSLNLISCVDKCVP